MTIINYNHETFIVQAPVSVMIFHQRNTEKGRGGMPLKAFVIKNDCFMQKMKHWTTSEPVKVGFENVRNKFTIKD